MTTFEPLVARDVVLAVEADARVALLLAEVDDLATRVREVSTEVETAEASAPIGGSPELTQSEQLTLRFVDDLLATNRERMREVIFERYAWVSQRLSDAQAEAQDLTDAAVAELAAALAERESCGSTLDDRSVADILGSVATPGEPQVTEAGAGPSEAALSELRAREGGAVDGATTQPSAVDPAVVDELVVSSEGSDADEQTEPTDQEAMIDDAVGSAVQAVLRALAASADEGAEHASVVEPAAAAAVRATEPKPTPEHLAWILPDDAADDVADGGGRQDPTTTPRHDFWGDAEDGPTKGVPRFAPRDLMFSMLLLVLVVVVGLALIA